MGEKSTLCTSATHSDGDQKSRNAATKCVLREYSGAKCDYSWGSALDQAVEHSMLPQIQ